MDSDWPSLNSRAWLRLSCCGAEHPTRVEGFTEKGACIVATPNLPHTTDVEPRVADGGFFLGWVSIHQALEAPVQLTEHADSPIPTWTIEATGDVNETQRRNYVRINMALNVELELIANSAVSKAVTVDVSEGGVRCFVDEWAPDPGGREFKVSLHLPDKTYVIPAFVAWWGNLDEKKKRCVGVRFEHSSDATADDLRKFIFARQLEERRRANQ